MRDGTSMRLQATTHRIPPAEKTGDPPPPRRGFTGLEIAVGAYAGGAAGLPLVRFVELLSTNPARILGLDAERCGWVRAADVTIFAEREWIVDPGKFASKGKCTPFAGRVLPRKVLATIVGGALVYRAEDFAA